MFIYLYLYIYIYIYILVKQILLLFYILRMSDFQVHSIMSYVSEFYISDKCLLYVLILMLIKISYNVIHHHHLYQLYQKAVTIFESSPLNSVFIILVVPVQVATTVVAMNTDHPEWILPITVDYLFESPQGKKSCNSFIFLS